jgi:hypothetical protein
MNLFINPTLLGNLDPDLTAVTPPLPDGWSASSTTCMQEGTNGRALTGASLYSSDMTPNKCIAFCADQNYMYAGLEFSQQCYCGASLSNGASLSIPSTQCNMLCGGDGSVICGGSFAISLYVNPSIVRPAPAAPTTLPSGWAAASSPCIKEVNGRALASATFAANNMTVPMCLAFCEAKGFAYAGVEFARECYCSGQLDNSASLTSISNNCNLVCAGDSLTLCGGANALQLYFNQGLVPPAYVAPVVNGYTAQGCFQEVAGRALTGKRVDDPNMTIQICTASCAADGYKFAGVEYGVECYCGNTLDNGASTSLVSGQCYMDCPGGSGDKCGGPNAIDLYSM